MRTQIEPSVYFNDDYDSRDRYFSYWNQVREILSFKSKETLEIGVGNSFVSNYLRERGKNIVTVDIDERLAPGVVGTVLELPFSDASFDLVACFEVLEHLPYEEFRKALSEMYRVSRNFGVMSLPDANVAFCIHLLIPKIGWVQKVFTVPRLRDPIHTFDGKHYWEIGKAGYPLKRVINDIRDSGFIIKKTYRVLEIPYHRFFLLEKNKRG